MNTRPAADPPRPGRAAPLAVVLVGACVLACAAAAQPGGPDDFITQLDRLNALARTAPAASPNNFATQLDRLNALARTAPAPVGAATATLDAQ